MYLETKNRCEWFSLYSITLLCLLGATYLSGFLIIPETGFLEIIFFIAALLAFFKYGINQLALVFSLLSLFYLLYSLFFVLLVTQKNIIDFIQAYKSYYYLILLGFFYKRRVFSEENVVKFYRLIVILFLIKYSTDKFLLNVERPTLLIENNFELIMLILTYYLVNIIRGKLGILDTLIILVVCFISGSRSSFSALLIAILFSMDRRLDIRKILYMVLIPIVLSLVFFIFSERLTSGSSLESIDRYRFLLEFIYSVSDWPWWRFFIGSEAITPLSIGSCHDLAYYESLFSYAGNGECYSVILHSFLLRVIYDHGIIGFFMLLIPIWIYLYKFKTKHKMCVILILLATALSVSSLNNVYVALSLILFIGIDSDFRKKRQEDSEEGVIN
jgi:hypothetical protein